VAGLGVVAAEVLVLVGGCQMGGVRVQDAGLGAYWGKSETLRASQCGNGWNY
jgi:hypothetical protein